MPKHSKEIKGSQSSLALFDESPAKTKPVKQSTKSDSSLKKSKDNKTKADDTRKSGSRIAVDTKRSKSGTSVQTKKESREREKRKHTGASQTVSKPTVNKRTVSKSDDNTVKGRSKTVRNRKSNKIGADIDKKRKSSVGSKSVASSRKAARITKGNKPVKDTEPRTDTRIDADIKEAKKYWRKHRYDRAESISQPRPITGKPKRIDDDFSLVAVIVDGKYLEVSPWSIINGVYHPGLDSNFIVNRLNTGTKSPNVLPKSLANQRSGKKKEKK